MSKRSLGRVVVAPDKFKGSASAHEVAAAIARGFRAADPSVEIVSIPMADGGDGTVTLFIESGAKPVSARVHDPLGRPIDAVFALDGARAIVEMAAASGLVLLRAAERDPWRADSRGTGELMRAALDAGATELIVAIGGSATNDAGIGMLRALGARTDPPDALHDVVSIDLSGLDPRLKTVRLEVASDVDNPLCGPHGASAIFGPQKGATPADVPRLDAALERTANALEGAFGRQVRSLPGAGAAGGVGGALLALGATLRPGVEIVAELRGLDRALSGAALCATGEGAIDRQTLHGKTVAGVARHARSAGVRVIAFGGMVDRSVEDELAEQGVVCVPVVTRPTPLAEAMRDSLLLIEAAATRAARLLGDS